VIPGLSWAGPSQILDYLTFPSVVPPGAHVRVSGPIMSAHAVARFALLLLFALATLPGYALEAAADSPAAADVRVIYWVDQTFGASYISNVMLTNMTTEPLENWQLGFDLDPTAEDIRGATYTVSGIRHSVSGAGWTSRIEVGESVWFSIDGVIPGDGSMTNVNDVPRPTGCVFDGQTCSFEELSEPAPNPQDTLAVDVGWWVASQGVTQFRAQILLKNISDEPIEYWNLKFRSTSLITNIEHGDWKSNGINYEVTGRGWTNSIEPDEIAWLTLSGVHTGVVDTLESCIFNGFPCSFVDPLDFVQAPTEPEIPVGNLCSIASPDASKGRLQINQKTGYAGQSNYNVDMEIINVGPGAVRDWEVSFQLPFSGMTILDLWPVAWTKSGTRVTLSPMPWNVCIEPDEIIRVGFNGTHEGLANPPTDCQINGESCDFGSLRLGSVTTSREEEPTNPADRFELATPYPNPFSTSTNIPFRVHETQEVSVALWDLQGRRVETLFEGTAVAGQPYEIRVPSGSLRSGLYMVRLVGGSGAAVTAPVMLVR
jgi:Cellulose binding domain